MIETEQLDRWLHETGALRRGHFRLSSGLHSPAYVQCALLLEQPERARRIAESLAERLRPQAPDSILSPALGGLIIGFAVASALSLPFRFVERVDGKMQLRRGFELHRRERIAIVEDVVTTGRSTGETADVAQALGAEVCAVASILDRSDGRAVFDVPWVSLKALSFPTYPQDACPLCTTGAAIDKPGSRPDS